MEAIPSLVATAAPETASNLAILARDTGSSVQIYSNIHPAIYGFGATSLFLVTLTTAIRIYTKFHIFRVRRWDDFLMIASWCGIVCMWSFIFASVKHGAGDNIKNIKPSDVNWFQKYAFLHELFYAIIQCLLKTSIALQILHIFVPNLSFRGNRDWRFWIIVAFIVLQNIWFICFFWISLFQCSPVRKEFDPYIPGHCLGGWNAYNIVVSTWNMVSDISMLVFPLICIWHLKMGMTLKIHAAGVFFVALLAVASSLLRLIFTIHRLYTDDLTLVMTQIALCDTGEITAGMITGNSVPLPRFIAYISEIIRARIKGEPVIHDRVKERFDDMSVAIESGARPERNMSTASSQMLSFEELLSASRATQAGS